MKKPVRPQPLLDATIIFRAKGGAEVTFDWSAVNGDVTSNGQLVHNTNDLALLHTIAKGMIVTRKS